MPAIQDEASGWYQGWYFDLRLEEELARSARHHLPLTLLVLYVSEVNSSRDRWLLNELLSDAARRKLRRTDIPAKFESDEYVVLLPQTAPHQAGVVIKRLATAFAPYHVAFGVASFPEDGEEAEQILAEAELRAHIADMT